MLDLVEKGVLLIVHELYLLTQFGELFLAELKLLLVWVDELPYVN